MLCVFVCVHLVDVRDGCYNVNSRPVAALTYFVLLGQRVNLDQQLTNALVLFRKPCCNGLDPPIILVVCYVTEHRWLRFASLRLVCAFGCEGGIGSSFHGVDCTTVRSYYLFTPCQFTSTDVYFYC